MLTDSKIRAAKPKEKAYKISDSGGLYLHIQASGSKYWRCKYRFLGKEKMLCFGTYPSLSLAKARSMRDEAKEQLRNNIDPALVKQRQKDNRYEAAANSFSSLANEWLLKHGKVLAAETAKRTQAMLNNDVLPYLGKRPIAEIETFELVGCLNRIVDRGAIETAHKVRNILNQVCRYAKQTGRVQHNPASDLVGSIPPKRKSHRPAIVEPEAFGRLLIAIDQYQGTMISVSGISYDGVDRLKVANGPWGAGLLSYSELDNIETKSMGAHSLAYTYNTKNQLESVSGSDSYSFEYDILGNVTDNGRNTFGYSELQLRTVGGSVNYFYSYDAHLRRTVEKKGLNSSQLRMYSKAGVLLYEEDFADSGLNTSYFYLGSKLIAKASECSDVDTDSDLLSDCVELHMLFRWSGL